MIKILNLHPLRSEKVVQHKMWLQVVLHFWRMLIQAYLSSQSMTFPSTSSLLNFSVCCCLKYFATLFCCAMKFYREHLSFFDGTRPSKGLYLAILGRVYNVQKGAKYYGPGGSYNFFAGISKIFFNAH